ncbi:hypothetical protein ENSA5_26170 [Enhygromyxa salina]|uniref:Uncharacterized protein n=1 Tax=Enhygromyxa salina TaxID=215803 RepID=A0A2S9YAL7_9BACT|nr:hypothetical protein [Enhygromyxa salina]PRQ02158.1 hypothetical protein ENSA5_26170 [Enhygromyxa salina]
MRVRLRSPFADLELRASGVGETRERFRDRDSAFALLRPALAELDPTQGRRLRSLLFEAGDAPASLDDHELAQRVARLIVRGDIAVVVRPRAPMVSGLTKAFEAYSERSLAPVLPPLVDADHWIEFALQTETGDPIAGVRCEITMPWGLVITRTTDRLGLIRLEHLPDTGQCLIRFPELDDEPEETTEEPDEWELVETYSEDEILEPTSGGPGPRDNETETPPDDWALTAAHSDHEQPELTTRSDDPGSDGGSSSPSEPDDWALTAAHSDHEQPELGQSTVK